MHCSGIELVFFRFRSVEAVLMDGENFGVVSGAYFVPRQELLAWVNNLLQLQVTKVEEMASGAAHCQIFDCLYPGKVALRRVKYDAKMEYEFEQNFKVLQDAFVDIGISRSVPTARLIKAKYQDNLEFLQWVHEYFLRNYRGQPYDAHARRSVMQGYKSSALRSRTQSKSRTQSGKQSRNLGAGSVSASRGTPLKDRERQNMDSGSSGEAQMRVREELLKYEEKLNLAYQTTKDLKTLAQDLENERDFYFAKISQVEQICKSAEAEIPNEVSGDATVSSSSNDWKMRLLNSIYDVLYDDEGVKDQPAPAQIPSALTEKQPEIEAVTVPSIGNLSSAISSLDIVGNV